MIEETELVKLVSQLGDRLAIHIGNQFMFSAFLTINLLLALK
jgi:hypothetical protein